jgi:hypothetical protein
MATPGEDLSNVPASVIKQQEDAEAKIAAAKLEAENPMPAQQETPLNTDIEPTAPNPVIPPAPDSPPAPVAPAISDGLTPDGQWEHKYSVLQGKYNKEVGELKGIVVDMQSQMERQEKVIESMNSKTIDSPSIKVGEDLNPDDFAGWGDEMKLMVNQVNSLKSIITDQNTVISGLKGGQPGQTDDGLQTRVESLETEINDNRAATYLKFLDENIKGDWRVLNKDPNFNAWIDQQDPISLQPRRTSLTSAASQLRGDQVSSIFNLYISANAAGGDVTIADALPGGSGNSGLEDVTHRPKKETTQDEVTEAQRQFVQGKITEEDFDKIYSAFQATLRRQQKS